MKVLLAGGYGVRLSEETDVRPKPIMEVGSKLILWHAGCDYVYKIGKGKKSLFLEVTAS
jgi:NDP-sugar pyrophosphorylase family protein